MKNTNTKKQSSNNKNLKNVETLKATAIQQTEKTNTPKKGTLKAKVLKQTMYLLKVNPNGLQYSELIEKVMNRIKGNGEKKGTKNSIHGCLQKENYNGKLQGIVTVNNGLWKLSSLLFALFF